MKYKVTLKGKTYEVEVNQGEAMLLDEYEAYAPAPAAAPAVAESPAASEAAPMNPDEALISDLVATETLRREALDKQAAQEMAAARAAIAERDWETATRQYRLAYAHLNDRPDSSELRRECVSGMAEAQYQAGK